MLPAKANHWLPMRLLISGSPRYQVQSAIGKGAFGNVLRCMSLEDKRTVAVKMVELENRAARTPYKEVDTLRKLRPLDPNKSNIVRWNHHFVDRGHLCLVFECLDKSLMEYMKDRDFRPLLLKEIRPVVQQIANALKHLKALRIIHADLKLENVMLVDQVRQPFRIKVIDFGLSCKASDTKWKSYLQTRPYRSPEILLGHPFFEAIDMWSLGCMAAALYLGTLLYPGCGEYEMLRYIIETQGPLPQAMLNRGRKTPTFFKYVATYTNSFWKLKTPEMYHKETGKQPVENRALKFSSLDRIVDVRPINTCNLENKAAEMADVHMFVDMLKKMLQVDPKIRITPEQLLEHRFISMLHIVAMDKQSNYVRSCFQTMELCQTKREHPENGQTSDSRMALPRSDATDPVQQNPPPPAERPHHPGLLSCPGDRRHDGPRKRKIKHDDEPPPKMACPRGSRGPSGHTHTEGQALPAPKRKCCDDVPPLKNVSAPGQILSDGHQTERPVPAGPPAESRTGTLTRTGPICRQHHKETGGQRSCDHATQVY